MTTFGELLKEYRKRSNITLRSFAGKMEVSPSYLSDIENDRCLPPYKNGNDFVEKAASLLDLSQNDKDLLYYYADKSLSEKYTLAHEIAHYLLQAPEAQKALRKAANSNVGNEVWSDVMKMFDEEDN